VNGALEAVEDGADDIHADAATRNFGYLGSGAESRLENKIERFLVGQALGLFGFQDSLLNSAGPQGDRINAPAIVTDFDNNLRALVISIEIDRAASWLAGGQTFISGLNAMVHGVANQMHERFSKGIENALIEICVLAGKFESHILAALLGNIADDAGKTPEELFDRHHAYFNTHL